MASNEVLLLSMFSFAASAILLANTIANLLLNQIVVRRFNMARTTALGCSPLSCCILKKRKINSRQTPLLGETRKNGFMVAKHDSKSLFRMSKNEFMMLVDSYRNGSQCSVYMIPV